MPAGSASGVAAGRRAVPVAPAVKKSTHPLNAALVRTWRNPLGFLGCSILGLLVLAAISAPLISPFDPNEQHQGNELLGRIPSSGWVPTSSGATC